MSSVYKKLQRKNQQNIEKRYLPEEERPVSKKQKKEEETRDDDSSSSNSSQAEGSNDEKDNESEKGSVKSEIDPEEELRAFKDADPLSKEWKNRQRVLMVCQRGIEGRFRHLMEDLINLVPHSKKEAKVEKK